MAESITISKLSGFGRGKEEVFEKSSISLGTDISSDVRFDPTWDKTVSPRHALIEKRSDGWWLVDQSRDGSWINGQRVQNAKVADGSVVELGRGGPRVKIGYAVKPADRAGDVTSRVPTTSTSATSTPAPTPRTLEPTVKTSSNGTDKSHPSAPAPSSRSALPIALAATAVAVVATTLLAWFVFHNKGSKSPGEVTVISTPAPGATAEWQPVVDMGEILFPSFLIASATMKESPFDAINSAPTRLGDKRGIVGIEITGAKGSKLRVEIGENEMMRASVYDTDLPDNADTYRIYPTINYRFDTLGKVKQTTPLVVSFSVSQNGVPAGQKSKTIRVASINDCLWKVAVPGEENKGSEGMVVRMDWMFAAYVNENHTISDELRRDALKSGIVTSFEGSLAGDPNALFKEVFAIWNVVRRRGTHYSNITTTPGESETLAHQYVRFIDQSINNAQANCADGSILFASVLRQIGIEPFLVLVPGHMFMGFFPDPNGKPVFLETTAIGSDPDSMFEKNPEARQRIFSSPRAQALQGLLAADITAGRTDQKTVEIFIIALELGDNKVAKYSGTTENTRTTKRLAYASRSQPVRKQEADFQVLPIQKAREMGVMPIGYQP
jgi:hypothetical protein